MSRQMPQRPDSHRGESASKRAFEAAVPHNWLVRPIVEGDYGIDVEVEIFDGDSATGATFKVQLKSKQLRSPQAATKSVKVSTLNYWLEHDVPVLVVLYDKSSQRIWGSWAHAHDTGAIADGAATTTFKYSDADELTSNRLDEIGMEVFTLRALKERLAPRPTPLRGWVAGNLPRTSGELLLSDLKTAIGSSHGEFSYEPESFFAITVRYLPDKIVAELPARKSTVTLHIRPSDVTGSPALRRGLSATIMIACSLLFDAIHLRDRAANVVSVFAEAPVFTETPYISDRIAGFLTHERRFDVLTRLLIGRPLEVPRNELSFLEIAVQMNYDELNEDEQRSVEDFYERRRHAYEDSQQPREAALASYSCTQFARARRDFPAAIEALKRTAALDPRYLDRGYYHAELAGSLWQVERYSEAADEYAAAHQLGVEDEVRHLWIDSLYWAGRFTDVVSTYTEQQPDQALAKLTAAVALLVVETLGVDTQDRRPVTEEEYQRLDDGSLSPLAILTTVDALDPAAWIRFIDECKSPGLAVVAASLSLVSSGQAWATALIMVWHDDKARHVLDAVVDSGLRFERDEFLQALEDMHANVTPDLELDKIISYVIREDSRRPSRPREPFTLRVHYDDGGMDAMRLIR